MFKKFRTLCCLILVAVFALSSSMLACAAGTTMIQLSKNNAAVGDKISVTVSGTDSSAVTVKYTSSVMSLQSCSAAGYTSTGNTVTFQGKDATFSFKTVAAGKANVIVTSDKLSGSSAALTVGETDTSSDSDSKKTQTATSPTSTTKSDFVIDNVNYVISERFNVNEIPAGFEKTDITWNDSTYTELSNGSITLIYLKPSSNTASTGAFYLYQDSNHSVSPLHMVGNVKDYVIVLTPDSLVNENLSEIALTIDDKQIPAYQFSDKGADFYYLYGVDENKETGWFSYDSKEKTIQRVNTDVLAAMTSTDDVTPSTAADSTASDKAASDQGISRSMKAIFIFAIALVAIIILNVLAFRKKTDEDDSEENDSTKDDSVENDIDENDSEDEDFVEKKRFFFGKSDVKPVKEKQEKKSRRNRKKEEEDDIWAEHDTKEAEEASSTESKLDDEGEVSDQRKEEDLLSARANFYQKKVDTIQPTVASSKKSSEEHSEDDLKVMDFNDL